MFEHHKKESPIISLLGMGGGVGSYAFIRRGVDGYEIARSLRFNSADSAYLSRTPASAGNRKTWTWAGWVKRSGLGAFQDIWGNGDASALNGFLFRFDSGDKIDMYDLSGSVQWRKVTTQVFRDASAWYHFVISYDTTNATAGDRVRLYVNGERITAFSSSSDPSLNYDGYINNTNLHAIGRTGQYNGLYLSGYLADIHFIDGQALDPSNFGEFDTNNVWQPKAFSGGSYGTNGFRLDFSDNSSSAALGYDAAGSNDWTVNNLSVTAGSGNDSLRDSPTNGSQTDTGVGGVVVGNYATWNPLNNPAGSTFANGNLDCTTASGNKGRAVGTIAVSSGKWYWEVVQTGGSAAPVFGFTPASESDTTYPKFSYYGGLKSSDYFATYSSYGANFGTNDVIGVALDLDGGTCTFYKNGTSQGQAFSGLSGTFVLAIADDSNSNTINVTLNAGQRPFAYTAPSGFKALCTTNLPAPTIANGATVFEARAYTGNGTTQTLSGFQFSPDFVWLKSRASVNYHELYDTIRGGTRVLYSNVTAAEEAADGLTSFTSDGFNLGDYDPTNALNGSYIAWAWDAGTSNATNTSGSITSTVRANISAGFSVITLTTPASTGNYSIGHGLGIKPAFTIWKSRTTAGNYWFCQHQGLGNMVDYYIRLESTAAGAYSAGRWVNEPTSSLLYTNVGNTWNTSDDLVCYCFAPVAGYSAFGSYTGNGSSSGPFVYLGFRPAFIMVKRTDSSANWVIWDNKRDGYNVNNDQLYPNLSNAEDDGAFLFCDQLSNGFRVLNTSAERNASGGTYAYVAFAEHPFRSARAR